MLKFCSPYGKRRSYLTVNPGSKAATRGVREGDLITSINGQSTKSITNQEAQSLLRNSGNTLRLGLNEENINSPKRRSFKSNFDDRFYDTHKRSSVTSNGSTAYAVSTINRLLTSIHNREYNGNSIAQLKGQFEKTSSIPSSAAVTTTSYTESAESRVIIEMDDKTSDQSDASNSTASTKKRRHNRRNNRRKKRINQQLDANNISESNNLNELVDCVQGTDLDTTDDFLITHNSNVISYKSNATCDRISINNTQGQCGHNKYVNIEPCNRCDSCNINQFELINGEHRNNKNNATKDSIDLEQRVTFSPSENNLNVHKHEYYEDISNVNDLRKSPVERLRATCESLKNQHDSASATIETTETTTITLLSKNKKRHRNKKKLNKTSEPNSISTNHTQPSKMITITEAIIPDNNLNDKRIPMEETITVNNDNYRVESPPTTQTHKTKKPPIKSRSLDDDQNGVQIMDVTDQENIINDEDNAIFQENNAIIIEEIDENEWETANELRIPNNQTSETCNVIAQCLDHQQRIITPEEEKNLRECLRELKLGTESENKRKKLDLLSPENLLQRRAQKRAILNSYFVPSFFNQRYLDVIHEEGSDLSDRELLFDDDFWTGFYSKNSHRSPQLLETKLIDCDEPDIKQLEWKTDVIDSPCASDAEIVFIDDSASGSCTPSDCLENDADDEISHNDNIAEENESSELNTEENDKVTPFFKELLDIISENNEEKMYKALQAVPMEELPEEMRETVEDLLHDKNFKSDNDEKLNQEVDDLYGKMIFGLNDDSKLVNVSSRQESSNSPCSSSSLSTLSTVRYIPTSSSLSDIASLLQEECSRRIEIFDLKTPKSLKELCVSELISQPHGADILLELANVSETIEKNIYPENYEPSPIVTDEKMDQTWIGIPTHEDPNLLVCLSPSQQRQYDSSESADQLLDMHRKFIERRSYHESAKINHGDKNTKEGVTLCGMEKNSSKRLLAIIRENNLQQPRRENITEVSHTLPVNSSFNEETMVNSDRLHVDSLSEWMNLARSTKLTAEENMPHESKAQNGCDVDTIVTEFSEHTIEQQTQRHRNVDENNLVKTSTRRVSLPQELHDKQLRYILEKEREIEREIAELELEKKRFSMNDEDTMRQFDPDQYHISRNRDIATIRNNNEASRPKSMPIIPGEFFRQQMYEEYMHKIAEREDRKQHKVIKVTSVPTAETSITTINNTESITSHAVFHTEIKNLIDIENEFMDRVKKRKSKLGIDDSDDENMKSSIGEQNSSDFLVLDGVTVTNGDKLPKHLQEFASEFTQNSETKIVTENIFEERRIKSRRLNARGITRNSFRKNRNTSSLLHEIDNSLVLARGFLLSKGVWSPKKHSNSEFENKSSSVPPTKLEVHPPKPPAPPATKSAEEIVWTPKNKPPSPTSDRKEFRPIKFESPTFSRKTYKSDSTNVTPITPPWEKNDKACDELTASLDRRLPTSYSAPSVGFNTIQTGSRLPKAQNPTITLLQKAREGQLPRGTSYIEDTRKSPPRKTDDRPPFLGPHEIIYSVKNEYIKDSDKDGKKKMVDLGPRKFEGIGPTTKDGMPIILRSEVKDTNQTKWYKRMYETLHKAKDDDCVTVRYKQRKGQYPSNSGYLSEPEPNGAMYDSDDVTASKYATLDRRRAQSTTSDRDKENYFSTLPRNSKSMSTVSTATIKHGSDTYRNQPGRIENYVPGHSSISEKEAKEWWDEVMDIFDGWLDENSPLPNYSTMLNEAIRRRHLEQQKLIPNHTSSKSYMAHALKESGYESDSTLIFRRREDPALQLSPQEQKEAYKSIQKGGEVPLHGLRKTVPERPKEDAEIEYFPISPTLTRIRVHKKHSQPANQIICYPLTVHTSSPFKIPKSTTKVPSPPKRRSSRYSSTLRLVSTMTVSQKAQPNRHESCHDSVDRGYLRDQSKGGGKSKVCETSKRRTKSVPTSISSATKTLVTLTPSKNPTKIHSTNVYRTQSKSPISRRNLSEPNIKTSPKTTKISRPISAERTFGTAKRKVDLSLPHIGNKIIKSPNLTSPKVVSEIIKKDVKKPQVDVPIGSIIKKTTTTYTQQPMKSDKTKIRTKAINTTVYVTPQGKEVFKTSSPILTRTASPKISESSQNKTKPLQKSNKIDSPKIDNKTNTSGKVKKIKNDKKDKKIGKPKDIKSKQKENKAVVIKCAGRAAGTEIVKKLKDMSSPIPPEPPTTFCGYGLVTVDEIKQQQHYMQSDNFFQKLLMRDIPSPTSSILSSRTTSVLEKAKKFQTDSKIEYPRKSSNSTYLSQKRPVSESKFKSLDFDYSLQYPDNCRLFSHVYDKIQHFDSLSQLGDDDFSYTSSLRGRSPDSYYGRSSSEPPMRVSDEFRPTKEIRSPRTSASPSPVRSPAQKRIINIRGQLAKIPDRASPKPLKNLRARSAGDADAVKRDIRRSLLKKPNLSLSTSSLNLSNISEHSEYQTYITELLNSGRRSDKFKALKRFYENLERFEELARTTSTSDLRPRRKDEEIIDFDLWKKVRSYERAEQELHKLYKKLKEDQKEKGFLFQPSSVENIKWKREKERCLRLRDKSIVDLKNHFTKLHEDVKKHVQIEKDTYKPLWRGSSVINLAQHMVEKRSISESRAQSLRSKPVNKKVNDFGFGDGIGARIWSSLSMEQVNAIKSQLAEIYSAPNIFKPTPTADNYVIQVPSNDKSRKDEMNSQLHIRSNSLSTADSTLDMRKPHKTKADSISSISTATLTPPLSKSLTENEKKRMSLTLSQEVLDRLKRRQNNAPALSPVLLAKETRGAIAAAKAKLQAQKRLTDYKNSTASLEVTEMNFSDEKDLGSPFTETKQNTDNEDQRFLKTDTESASSETSTKTIIYKGNKENIQKKVDFFEKNDDPLPPKVIYKPNEKSEDSELEGIRTDIKISSKPRVLTPPKLMSSQSVADLKELFGEQRLSPIPPRLQSQNKNSPSLLSRVHSPNFRTRSLSPDPEKYWRAYLALVKTGEVQKIKSKFENLEDVRAQNILKQVTRRYGSDPELARVFLSRNGTDLDRIIVRAQEFGDVEWLRRKYESKNSGRGRSRTRRNRTISSPIPKNPLRLEDRLMPHINVISKLASLSSSSSSQSKNKIENKKLPASLGCPVGEVEKLRYKFDSPDRQVSLLGQMFTSSPDIQELRDIAPYLTGPWVAHQFPYKQDNSRSLSSTDSIPPFNNGTFPPRRVAKPRPKSASPPRTKPPSILKTPTDHDIFANQHFDPSIHRPICRYQPSESSNTYRSWWSPVPTMNFRPTVTFKGAFLEPEMIPVPPPKGQHLIRDIGPESPRRYLENEVTIHYRTPIRQEIKEAISEEELARRQAEAMRRIYQEERRRKYLQELQDMNSRRHTDNFTPSQKSPIPLNRYDDFDDIKYSKMRDSPRLVARALYNFVGQSSRELTFRKGDVIYVRRQIDKNWYEGEHNAMIGLFPSNYVEIIPYESGVKSTVKKSFEGQARAKFNFVAQTHLELSLAKGELVILTRRVDENWFEGRIGNKKGIFPVSYVDVLAHPGEQVDLNTNSNKPVASPAAHSLLLNGSSGGKQSMGSHHYQPSYSPGGNGLSNNSVSYHHAKPVNVTPVNSNQFGSLTRQPQNSVNINQTLHIDTHSDPVPYRAMYKYRPQNEDELELLEGDTVYVLEKCDDGWYVGSSQRTGAFGTFPGNYVEKI